jgi:hypothetical protein
MTPTPIALLEKAAELGLKLKVKDSMTLRVEPGERCPPAFADTLKDHKWLLLDLLQLPFVMVYSHAVEEMLFFCEDEATKAALVKAGADEWSIYTRAELRVLVAQNRIAPLSQAELRKLHEIKRTFGARIAQNNLKFGGTVE